MSWYLLVVGGFSVLVAVTGLSGDEPEYERDTAALFAVLAVGILLLVLGVALLLKGETP